MPTYEMLHGTSSAFLESIKQNGLIPDSKNKVWSDFSKATYDNPSCKSLTGIYLTNNLNTAFIAGKNASEKYPGNVLIISTIIDSSTALSDEDSIWCWVETWLEKFFKKFGFDENAADKVLAFIESQSVHNSTHYIKWFSEKLHNELTENAKLKIDYVLLYEVFYSALMRRCSHLFSNNRSKFSINYQSNHKLFKVHLPIKTIEEAEEDYLVSIEKLSIFYTESCVKETNLHTLRVISPIGYAGKNLIKGMLVINNFEVMYSDGDVSFIKSKLLHHKNFALCGI